MYRAFLIFFFFSKGETLLLAGLGRFQSGKKIKLFFFFFFFFAVRAKPGKTPDSRLDWFITVIPRNQMLEIGSAAWN